MNKWLGHVAYTTGGILVGFLISRLIPNIPGMSIDPEIDVVGAAALGITIVMVTAFDRRLERLKHSDALKKEALIRRLQRCGEKLDAVDATCHSGVASYVDLAAVCKGCRREADAFKKYVNKVKVRGIVQPTEEFVLASQELKELATNTSIYEEAQPMLSTKDGVTTIHHTRKLEIDRKIDTAHDKLREIELLIIADTSSQ